MVPDDGVVTVAFALHTLAYATMAVYIVPADKPVAARVVLTVDWALFFHVMESIALGRMVAVAVASLLVWHAGVVVKVMLTL